MCIQLVIAFLYLYHVCTCSNLYVDLIVCKFMYIHYLVLKVIFFVIVSPNVVSTVHVN